MISIVTAYSNKKVIGKNNKMPWNIRGDLEFFKKLTTGNIVIMGRKTFQSIGKVLPNRINIVITRNSENKSEIKNLYFTNSLKDAINLANRIIKDEVVGQDNNSNSSCYEKISRKNPKEEINLSQSAKNSAFFYNYFLNYNNIEENSLDICKKIEDEFNIKKTLENSIYITNSFEEDEKIKKQVSLSQNIEDVKIKNINSDIIDKIKPKEIFIIGGQSIYEQSIDIADRIYVTKIDYNYDGDRYFPYFDEDNYRCKILKSESLPVKHSFILYEKIK